MTKKKRLPKFLREKIDAYILAEAGEGRGTQRHLTEGVYIMLITNCGTIANFLQLVAGYYVTTRKQSLRQARLLEIGVNEVAKLPEDMNENDKHAVLERRSKFIVGDTAGTAREAHRYELYETRDLMMLSLKELDVDLWVELRVEFDLV